MRILLVDDHPEVRLALGEFLQGLGHEALQAASGADALRAARERRVDLVLSDLRMPGMDGLQLLQELEELDDPPPLALMTAFGDGRGALEAMRLGAVDYLRKPIDVAELHRLVERIEAGDPGARGGQRAGPGPSAGAERPPEPRAREEADGLVIVGEAMERVLALADRLHGASDLPCLIEGETGVGKELIARRVHAGPPRGGRRAGPFIALNCAAIAPGLFEAELFGYAPGSFTGALAQGAEGKLAAAAGGTLFLDEIGDLPLEQQAKLLRLLEDRSWYPVGSNRLQRLNARVVCATNVALQGRARDGRFREDLFYRLKVGYLRIPPLRERRECILPLAHAFLARIRAARGRGFQRLSSAAEAALLGRPWPGNVRELLHLLEQACLEFDGAVLDASHLERLDDRSGGSAPPAIADALPRLPPAALRLAQDGFDLEAWERAVVAAALAQHDGSPVRTAAFLGISRKVLYGLRKRHGLLRREDGT